jgi:hypothetical protein
MNKWGWIVVLGLWVSGSAWTSEPVSSTPGGQRCAKGGCAQGNHGRKTCGGGTFWEWLCYRPARLPRECQSCLSPARDCTPPLYVFFLDRYHSSFPVVLGDPVDHEGQ